MGRKPKWGRPINGVFLLNKTAGMSSNAALQSAKRLFFAQKAGHTGSLDPLATGILPICFGEATKFAQYLLEADKVYSATFSLGSSTTTGDSEGELVSQQDASWVNKKDVESLLPSFMGTITQTPPKYSALKFQGKPLYQWAREGLPLPDGAISPRQVHIHRFDLVGFQAVDFDHVNPSVDVEVHCSKGTYIRTLAEDLGEALGCGAYVSRLDRVSTGPFQIHNAMMLDDLECLRGNQDAAVLDEYLLPLSVLLEGWPELKLDKIAEHYFRQGQPVMNTEVYRFATEDAMVRVCTAEGNLIGIGKLVEGSIRPKRILSKTADFSPT